MRAACAWLLACLCALADGHAAPLVRTAQGVVQGRVDQGVERFTGLPYAVAPARWSAPGPAPAWRGVRAPLAQSPRCPQSAAGLADGRESEDCLYLDLVRPAAQAPRARAVYVYVHGGGATQGGAADHDGGALAAEADIIVVSINYRLGALGFLNSALLEGEGGNYALQDVAAALRWVHASIGAFGGDPARITLGGESAGATVLCPLLGDPAIAAMLRAAIVSSDDCLRDTDTVETARARAADYVQRLGCRDAACLRGLPAAALVGGLFAAPTVGRQQPIRVPLLLGANRDEGRIAAREFFGFGLDQYLAWLERLVGPAHAARVERAYRHEGQGSGARFEHAYKASAVITDSGMRGFGGCSLLRLARAARVPVYLYQFEDGGAASGADGGFDVGAAHAAELPYLWPAGPFAGAAAQLAPPQQALARRMRADWGRFVRAGRPGWAAVQEGAAYLAYLPGSVGLRPLAAYRKAHRCALWDSIPAIMARGEARP
ncbi:carboxylesterase family protein [Massilia yuzhufengensis]|uniref:Carboxylic ester hydrolase n=1 Tax=Massilia yuzhufengensis TaxID=1164594 RepID=A0A1I1FXQ9_9BURK|nr:carboxylesterase family protein [Massilia yuzhufengensis]SFC02398.1 para-nitrobenzyl esterase [Massilia yuzhufengensis]